MNIKFIKYIQSAVLLIVLNIIYFLWQPYPKMLFSIPLSVSNIFTNTIYFFVYHGVLFFILKGVLFDSIEKKKIFGKAIIFLFLINVIISLIYIVIYSFDWIYGSTLFGSAFSVLRFALSLGFLKAYFKPKKIQDKKGYFFVIVVVIAVILFVFGYILLLHANDLVYVTNKYQENSMMYTVYKNNCLFKSQMQGMLFETVCEILIFSVFFVKYYKADEHIIADIDNRKQVKIVSVVSRMIVIIMTVGLLCVLKVLVLPKDSIANIKVGGTDSPWVNNDLSIDATSISINRRSGYENKKTVYSATTYYFKSKSGNSYKKTVDNVYLDVIMKDFTAENFAVADFYQKYNQELFSITDHKDDILEFKTYGNEFLIIKKENGEYAFFETKNINHMKFDTDLLNVCKYMIEKGNFSYFEYASEYLKIYDFQFIEKYIKRYSQGNFYDYEIENKYNDGIKLSYVKNLAQKQLVDE